MSFGRDRHRTIAGLRQRLALATWALAGGCLMLLAAGAYGVGGAAGIVLVAAAGVFSLFIADAFAPSMLLCADRFGPLPAMRCSAGQTLLRELAERAALPMTPFLFTSRRDSVNAFAVVEPSMTSVCVTDGLLRRLDRRELAGVLAHEVSHIRARDLRLLAVIDVARRLSIFVAGLGAVVIVFELPASGAAVVAAPLATLAALMAAPALIALMQLALARTRELDADLSAVALTGDPDGLAAALTKLDADAAGLPWIGPWGPAPASAPKLASAAPAPGRARRSRTEPWAATRAAASPMRSQGPDRRLQRPRSAAAARCGWLARHLLRTHPTTAERVRRIRQLTTPAA